MGLTRDNDIGTGSDLFVGLYRYHLPMVTMRPLSSSATALVSHARQSRAADELVNGTLRGLTGYGNPVIRLLASNGLLSAQEPLKAARTAAVLDLRAQGWTWTQIGSLLGANRQRAWQIGHGL